MCKAFHSFRCFAGRFKFISAVLAIFLSGVLLTIGTCAWYYGGVIERRAMDHDKQISRLSADVDVERVINRRILEGLAEQVQRAADKLDKTANVAETAASTAKSAAATASGAAKNAANANIRIREIKPIPGMRLE